MTTPGYRSAVNGAVATRSASAAPAMSQTTALERMGIPASSLPDAVFPRRLGLIETAPRD